MPLVSVIMGVYCCPDNIASLERAVCSILSQTLRNFELIICDDGSNQLVQDLLDRLASKDLRILLLRPGGVITLPQKLNYCLAHASGQFIARMDDDDVSHPERLEKQLDYLTQHPEIAFVGCHVNRIFTAGEKIPCYFPEFPQPKDFRFSMPFTHPALVFRREALKAANGYSEKKYCLLCEDYDLLLRLYALGWPGANLQTVLFDYSMSGVEQKGRKYRFRINEAVVRFLRFQELGLLPGALHYVIKPLVVGLLPLPLLNRLRKWRNNPKRRHQL